LAWAFRFALACTLRFWFELGRFAEPDRSLGAGRAAAALLGLERFTLGLAVATGRPFCDWACAASAKKDPVPQVAPTSKSPIIMYVRIVEYPYR
jgi:hypothetical protein